MVCAGLWAGTSEAQQSQPQADIIADFVWSEEFGGGSRILHSRFSDGTWSAPDTVIEDESLNILPAIAAASKTDMAVVWSVVKPRGIILKYSRAALDRKTGSVKWSSGSVLSEKRTVNLAPVVLPVDGGYRAFWSAHEGGDDDVLTSNLGHTGWTQPVMVHPENTWADVLPVAGFNENQDVWLKWELVNETGVDYPVIQFDTGSGVLEERAVNANALDLETLEKESKQRFSLDPPVFFRSKSRATMYIHNPTTHPVRLFPGNLLQ